jgi:hypothetical protein
MVKQQTISINLLQLTRIIAVVLLICFFLPWVSGWFGPLTGVSVVVELVSNFKQYITVSPLPIFFIIGWGFIPIGSLVILWLTYYRRLLVPILGIVTGAFGIIPFIFTLIMSSRSGQTYLPFFLTVLCLLALIVIGIVLYRKFSNQTPSSAF